MLERLFRLSERGATVKGELLAGLTTFLAMAYILAVNPLLLAQAGTEADPFPYEGILVATALSAGIASLLMGLFANYPIALAPGMGINAMFVFGLCGTMGFTWRGALAAVFVSGVLFLAISVTPLRKMVVRAIPLQLRMAIGAGIGFFIAFVGLHNAGIIVGDTATLVAFGDMRQPAMLLATGGILLTLALLARQRRTAIFEGLVATMAVGLLLGMAGVEDMPTPPARWATAKLDFTTVGAFAGGFGELWRNPNALVAVFSLLFIDFFDSAGTLVAIANRTNLVDDEGEVLNADRAFAADAVGTVVGAVLGTSTVTAYVESTAGVEAGGRTGMTAVFTGLMLLAATFFAPAFSTVTFAVTAPALIVVGILMAQQLGGIDWGDFVYAAAGFATILGMLLCYSISHGIALGFITYAAAMLVSRRAREVKPVVWCIIPVFVFYFTVHL